MKNIHTKILQLAALVSLSTQLVADSRVAPTLNFRSAGRDAVSKLVGTTSHHVYLYDMESYYGTFFIQPTYSQNFRSSRISECLFGDVLVDTDTTNGTVGTSDNDNSSHGRRAIVVSGTAVTGRGARDLMAENFLLPRSFRSVISFNPRVRTFSMPFHFFIALDEWMEGLYFRLYGPLVHTKYDLRFEESTPTIGTVGYEAGFFAPAAVPVGSLLQSFASYAAGNTVNVPGVTVQGLRFAKIPGESKSETCFGELRAELGYNFLMDEDYHFGLGLEVAAPTGHRRHAEFLFEPQCASKHWELGGVITGHYTFWRSWEDDKHFDFAVEADITHIFKAHEERTFDLKGKGLSRYLLAAQFGSSVTNLATTPVGGTGTPTAATAQFTGTYAPVANFSTREVNVSAAVQADVVAMFNFTAGGFSWDLGYNFWTRTREKIKRRDSDVFPENTWALKGTASMFGFAAGTPPTPVALSASQSGANIHGGVTPTPTTPPTFNTVDNPVQAFTNPTTGTAVALTQTGLLGSLPILTSSSPIFISANDLDIDGAETRGMSHSIFTHFNWTWVDREDWVPYVGVGAQVEFGRTSSNNTDTTTTTTTSSSDNNSSSINCALSDWKIWLKAGISFN